MRKKTSKKEEFKAFVKRVIKRTPAAVILWILTALLLSWLLSIFFKNLFFGQLLPRTFLVVAVVDIVYSSIYMIIKIPWTRFYLEQVASGMEERDAIIKTNKRYPIRSKFLRI